MIGAYRGFCGLPRRPLTVKGAHQNAEIEPGHMDQVAKSSVGLRVPMATEASEQSDRAYCHWDNHRHFGRRGLALYQYMITRRVEARQPFLNKQLELYFRTAAVVGKFAVLKPNTEEWARNEAEFWEIYWSELSVVESEEVEKGMVKVGHAIGQYNATPASEEKKKALNVEIYELADAIKASVKRGWRGL
jgi:hypothetical protein